MRYEIINKATLYAGILLLTKEQAMPRAHNLKEIGKGRYEVVKPVEFKIGETIGYEGDLPKGMANELLSDKARAEKAAAVAEAKAKSGPTVADMKSELDALGIEYDAKDNKATLADLLDYAKKVLAKALELSGMDRAAFDALVEVERDAYLDDAEKALDAG